MLVELKRLPDIGSEQFPVLAKLQYEPKVEAVQGVSEADRVGREEAGEMIEEGRDQAG